MSTAPSNFGERHEDTLSKQLLERESAIKERLQAAWQLHIARVQEELESGWQSHIGMAVEGVLVNLQDSLRAEMQESARKMADSQAEDLRHSLAIEADSRVQEALEQEREAMEQERQAVEQERQSLLQAHLDEVASLRAELEKAREEAVARLEELRQEDTARLLQEREDEVARLQREREEAEARLTEEHTAAMAQADEERLNEMIRLEETQRVQLQGLHKAVRRCEQAENREDVVAAVLDGVVPYASRAVLLQLEGDMITGFHSTEHLAQGAEPIALEIPVEQAPALHNAKQSGEPLVAMRLESEFSRELLEQVGAALDEKIRVFPLVSRNTVRALLLVEAGDMPFQASAVEILTITAGHKWTVGKDSAEPAQLITIQGSGTPETKSKEPSQNWFQLSPQEQEIHLRAQRYARVQVAELRLYQSERVRQARKDHNIYGVFRQEIDQVRTDFKTQFVDTCPSMLDYYHMELVRILANENEKVLGPDYPGPLV